MGVARIDHMTSEKGHKPTMTRRAKHPAQILQLACQPPPA
jgi:hypothetical protein